MQNNLILAKPYKRKIGKVTFIVMDDIENTENIIKLFYEEI